MTKPATTRALLRSAETHLEWCRRHELDDWAHRTEARIAAYKAELKTTR